jgi:hypothetical protein
MANIKEECRIGFCGDDGCRICRPVTCELCDKEGNLKNVKEGKDHYMSNYYLCVECVVKYNEKMEKEEREKLNLKDVP